MPLKTGIPVLQGGEDVKGHASSSITASAECRSAFSATLRYSFAQTPSSSAAVSAVLAAADWE